MNGTPYLLMVILVMSIVTFITRLAPFVAFRNRPDHPLLTYLGRYMPPMIMALLVLFCLKGVDFSQAPYGAVELLALFLTTLVHLWRANALLSIAVGTAFYMLAIQLSWFG